MDVLSPRNPGASPFSRSLQLRGLSPLLQGATTGTDALHRRARTYASHLLRRGDAEEIERARQDRLRGVAECQAERLLVGADDLAVAIEGREGLGQLERVGGDAVRGAAEEGGDEDFRVALSVVAKRVIARSLDLLGVEAPEHM